MEQTNQEMLSYVIGDTTYFIQRAFSSDKTIDEIIENKILTEEQKSHN